MDDEDIKPGNGYEDIMEMDDDVPGVKAEDELDVPFQFSEIDRHERLHGEAITEEDAWTVISAHFGERGLVGQQLDSFDYFMTTTMQVCRSSSFAPASDTIFYPAICPITHIRYSFIRCQRQ